MSKELYLATNNGDIGGGEVMLLNIARAARGLGYQVVIIGPANPPDLIEAAADERVHSHRTARQNAHTVYGSAAALAPGAPGCAPVV